MRPLSTAPRPMWPALACGVCFPALILARLYGRTLWIASFELLLAAAYVSVLGAQSWAMVACSGTAPANRLTRGIITALGWVAIVLALAVTISRVLVLAAVATSRSWASRLVSVVSALLGLSGATAECVLVYIVLFDAALLQSYCSGGSR